jgi:O-antigen/teichoic acid export membrane protein
VRHPANTRANASEQPGSTPRDSNRVRELKEDLTGRDRLVSNVVFSWAAHFVFIIAGFIMPRMIDRRLGQELLGVWDFAWSLVTYFHLVQAGVASAVNRYVARYRACDDTAGVNRIVSSASCILGVSALLVLGLTIALALLLPRFFGTRLGEDVLKAQWVVFFLGASLAVQVCFSAFGGVITGCHRWELQNIINSGWQAAIVAGMIVALLIGEGLRVLAVINFVGMVLAGATKVVLAHRVCKHLRVRISLIRWRTIRNLYVFGGKTLMPGISRMLLNQTTNILIVAYLGPAALALYARPRSLIRHIDTLVRKMAMVLIPTTSSLQGTGDVKGIKELLLKSVRYSLYLVLPMVLLLVIFGDQVLQFWMGPRYANGLIPAILAVGFLAAMAQTPLVDILVGLNAHGRAGLAQLIASLCSVGLAILTLGVLKWGLVGTAVAVTLPLTIMNVVYLPLLARRRIGLNVRQYFLSVTMAPAVHTLPFTICLLVARLVFRAAPLMGLALGALVGGAVLLILYWRYVLPERLKMWMLHYPRRLMRSAGWSATTKTVT